jgi:hypothetical protein
MSGGEWLVAIAFIGLGILALLPIRKPKAGSPEWLRQRDEALYRHCWHTVKREHPEFGPAERLTAAQTMMARLEAQRWNEFREPATADGGWPDPTDNR